MTKRWLTLGLSGLRVFGFLSGPWLSDQDIHQVIGEPSRLERPWDGHAIKIVTWNIEHGAEYGSVLRVLRGLDADILLLQEVDRDCRRSGYRDVARDLAVALEMNWVAAGEFQEIGEARDHRAALTGQAILSKRPIADAEALRFASQDRLRWAINPVQPRRGGRIALRARIGELLVYNTHIESGDNTPLKRRQMMEIVSDQSKHAVAGDAIVIAGDFNSGRSVVWSLVGAAFADALGDGGQRGATSQGQRDPIDWIFVKNLRALGGRVVDAADASDHSPVLADLDTVLALAQVNR
jgi:endonuclease/exonuclease/phosphatase family metal-dependent hydrolase